MTVSEFKFTWNVYGDLMVAISKYISSKSAGVEISTFSVSTGSICSVGCGGWGCSCCSCGCCCCSWTMEISSVSLGSSSSSKETSWILRWLLGGVEKFFSSEGPVVFGVDGSFGLGEFSEVGGNLSSSSTCLRIVILGLGVVLYDQRPWVRGSFVFGSELVNGADESSLLFTDFPGRLGWLLLGRKLLRRRVVGAPSVVVVIWRFLNFFYSIKRKSLL